MIKNVNIFKMRAKERLTFVPEKQRSSVISSKNHDAASCRFRSDIHNGPRGLPFLQVVATDVKQPGRRQVGEVQSVSGAPSDQGYVQYVFIGVRDGFGKHHPVSLSLNNVVNYDGTGARIADVDERSTV